MLINISSSSQASKFSQNLSQPVSAHFSDFVLGHRGKSGVANRVPSGEQLSAPERIFKEAPRSGTSRLQMAPGSEYTKTEERKLKVAQAFEKWRLTISSHEVEEDFLRLRSGSDHLLGPLVVVPRFEMEPENTQDGSPKTSPYSSNGCSSKSHSSSNYSCSNS